MSSAGRLLHIMLHVADIDRTLAFYALLGMRVQTDRSDPASGRRNLFLGFAGEGDATLIEIASPGAPPAPEFGHIAIATPDLIGLCDRLPTLGVAIERAPRTLGSGTQTAFLRDPDGHAIELVQPAGTGAIRRSLAHDGLDFATIEMGRGTPMLMLHGGASRADHFTELMAGLEDRHRCLAYDQRGFAGTGAGAATVIDHAHWAADVPAMLDALEIPRATLLGWSMGASVAINAARQWPDRVAALVLLGAPDPRRGVDVAKLRARQREADAMTPGALRDRDAAQLRSVLGDQADAALIGRLLAERAATPAELSARTIEAYATRPDLTALLPTLACPVHLIVGEQDPVCPLAGAEIIRTILPRATIDIVPGCSHYFALENPEAVAALILQRLQEA